MCLFRVVIAMTASALISGCAVSVGEDLEPFGTSVRQTTEAQTYEYGDSTPTLSGDKAANVIEAYRGRGPGEQAQSGSGEDVMILAPR